MRVAGVLRVGQPHPGKGEGHRGAAAFRRRGRSGRDLSVRPLPQHMNEEGFVHGGSAKAKLSVQRVDVHE
jgi:hypothetical protein